MSGRLNEGAPPGNTNAEQSNASTNKSAASSSANNEQAASRGIELPPLLATVTAQGNNATQPNQPRSASFSNILNPARDDGYTNRRRKISELQSPSSAPFLPPITTDGNSTSPANRSASPALAPQGRRILTPRSPLHRVASMGQLSASTGSLDVRAHPFAASPRPRTYAIEPGQGGVPPLPTSSSVPRPGYFEMAQASEEAAPVVKVDQRRSTSLSPRTSYQMQYQQSSPDSMLPTFSASNFRRRREHSPAESSSHITNSSIGETRSMGIPISSTSGHNVYQMMTLQTSSGAVQVPVDIQAASRVADEKRKRNAGASARFRARRKEKERESSTTISKLEMQVKELLEEVEFYRRERGYLAGVVLQVPGGERHFPRPPSPRHRRASAGMPGASTSGSASTGYLSGQDVATSPQDERNVRRRTSTLSLPVPGSSNYPSAHYDTPIAAQRHPSFPAHSQQFLPGPSTILAPVLGQHHMTTSPAGSGHLRPSQQETQTWHRHGDELPPPAISGPHEPR